jgi:hypothetical protein
MKTPVAFVLLLASPLFIAGCAGAGKRRQAGTGDVAFRLLWEGLSDLDLIVQDPSGACISYLKRRSPSNGVLDVDCNGGTDLVCERPVENIYWPAGAAPAGEYMFWVNAHSVIPARTPVSFRLQVLLGREVFWLHKGSAHDNEEVLGPFVYSFPSGKVAGPLKVDPDLPSCGRGFMFSPADQGVVP